jgi:hypothetical protein
MNLVFGSVLLFILISPGLIFRFSYLQGTYAKLTFKVSAVEEVFWALVPALFFQSFGILFVEQVLLIPVRLDVIYHLITGNGLVDFTIIGESLAPFLGYIFSLILISALSGVLARYIIRKLKLDIHWQFLRFGNEWHYLLSGEIMINQKPDLKWYNVMQLIGYARREIFSSLDKNTWIQIDILVNSSEGNMIYSGILENYYLSKENGLDRIYLRNVYRRKLKDDLGNDQPNVGYLDRHLDARYYSMPGDLLVFTYDKIINLNITYYINQEEQ